MDIIWGDGQADHEARTVHHFRSESADRPRLVVAVVLPSSSSIIDATAALPSKSPIYASPSPPGRDQNVSPACAALSPIYLPSSILQK